MTFGLKLFLTEGAALRRTTVFVAGQASWLANRGKRPPPPAQVFQTAAKANDSQGDSTLNTQLSGFNKTRIITVKARRKVDNHKERITQVGCAENLNSRVLGVQFFLLAELACNVTESLFSTFFIRGDCFFSTSDAGVTH